MAKKKVPKGEKAVNHVVQIEYYIDKEKTKKEWFRGKIIMYNKSRGYLIRFDNFDPDEDTWGKNIAGDDIKFLD